jgi:hypothetical protein
MSPVSVEASPMAEMEASIRTTKGKLWRELLWRKSVGIVVIFLTFASTAHYLWDEVVGTERPKLIVLLRWLPWYGWTILGLVVLVFLTGEHAYKLIHTAEEDLESAKAASRAGLPFVTPHEYGRAGEGLASGLTITNPGYAAFDIHIPPVMIEPSIYVLRFSEIVTQLGERDHKRFMEAWLDHPTLPGRDGSALLDVMAKNNIDSLPFAILYKDGNQTPLWYRSNCVIIRDLASTRTGLRVSYLSQERIPKPTMP